MQTYVIRRPSFCADMAELEACGKKSAEVGEQMGGRVRWVRSYVVQEPDGRLGTVCIYQARDGESIREHARRVGMPGEEFYPVEATVVVSNHSRNPIQGGVHWGGTPWTGAHGALVKIANEKDLLFNTVPGPGWADESGSFGDKRTEMSFSA